MRGRLIEYRGALQIIQGSGLDFPLNERGHEQVGQPAYCIYCVAVGSVEPHVQAGVTPTATQ